jgi:hypothetical protein
MPQRQKRVNHWQYIVFLYMFLQMLSEVIFSLTSSVNSVISYAPAMQHNIIMLERRFFQLFKLTHVAICLCIWHLYTSKHDAHRCLCYKSENNLMSILCVAVHCSHIRTFWWVSCDVLESPSPKSSTGGIITWALVYENQWCSARFIMPFSKGIL